MGGRARIEGNKGTPSWLAQDPKNALGDLTLSSGGGQISPSKVTRPVLRLFVR
jgi:hypothetical protein